MARPKQNSSIMLPHGRKRTISPGFFTDPDVVSLAPFDRLLFIGIWCYADKAGRLLDKPIDLKMRLFPNDDFDVDAGLERLAFRRLIHRYTGGRPRLRVLAMKEDKWREIQRINPNEPESALPAPSSSPSAKLARRLLTEGSKPPMVYTEVSEHQNPASYPILSPGPSGPAGPSGSSGSSGPSEPQDVSDHRNRSAEEELWIELEACRITRCIEVGLEPGQSKRRNPKRVNAMFLGAAEHLSLVDRQTSAGVITRWDQLGDLYEVYLTGDFGKDGAPPWPIELFCSHGVLERVKREADKLAKQPPPSEAAA